jgi:dUTP pyrophosphatase
MWMQCVSKLDFYKGKNDTNGNSGFDLYLPEDTVFPAGKVTFVDFGISAKTTGGSGFWVLPRSSLSKTPLRLANSMGLIDPSYRGNLIGAFDNTSDTDYTVEKGTRLLQMCVPVLMPFNIEWVDKLDDTSRGAGGFGSTGK